MTTKRKIAPAKFSLYTNEGGWTDDGLNLNYQFSMKVERWIKDHDSYSHMELLALMHSAIEEAWVNLSVQRKFCNHSKVPDDDDYCEDCGARLVSLEGVQNTCWHVYEGSDNCQKCGKKKAKNAT